MMMVSLTGHWVVLNALLVIDALDEAEMISGRMALETLLVDLRSMVKDSETPTVILCARTETAHYVKQFYSTGEYQLALSQYEIGFFEENNAKDFVVNKIKQSNKAKEITPVVTQCIDAQFAQIKRILDQDPEIVHSFIGYAPVLEALAVFFDEENNTMQLLQQTEDATNSTEIFIKIMKRILDRERQKVVNAFRERCFADYPEFTEWETVYTETEQMVRLAYYLIFDSTEYDNYLLELPRELSAEYGQSIQSFLKDHPFIHSFEGVNVYNDFTGPAFRDYVLARLMTMDGYDEFAKEYFSAHRGKTRFPSQLFFDFYQYFASRVTQSSHFPYLYDAFKSKETSNTISSVSIEQVDDSFYCNFVHEKIKAKGNNRKDETEFMMSAKAESICVSQLNNAYIDISEDLILGMQSEDVIISNSVVKCKRLLLKAPCVMLTAYPPQGTLIACSEGIDASMCPSAKFEVRTDNRDLLKISAPDIKGWFKLLPYSYKLEDETELDVAKNSNTAVAFSLTPSV